MMKMPFGQVATFAKVAVTGLCFGFSSLLVAQTLNYSGPVTAQNSYLSFASYLAAPVNPNSSIVFTGGNITFNFTAPQLEPVFNAAASYSDQVIEYGPGLPFRRARVFSIYDTDHQAATVTLGQTDFSAEAPSSMTTTSTAFYGWFLTGELCPHPTGAPVINICQYYFGIEYLDVVAQSGGEFSVVVPLSGNVLADLNANPWQMAFTLGRSNNDISLNGVEASVNYNWVDGSPNSAVPEPATWTLMLAGFWAVGLGMRRRRGQSSAAGGTIIHGRVNDATTVLQ